MPFKPQATFTVNLHLGPAGHKAAKADPTILDNFDPDLDTLADQIAEYVLSAAPTYINTVWVHRRDHRSALANRTEGS